MRILSSLLVLTVLLSSCANSKNKKESKQKQTNIQLIRNATLRLDYNGKTFMIDPSLSPKNSFTSFVVQGKNLNPTIDLTLPMNEITKGLDAIFVTHTHADHFDEGAKEFLNHDLPLFGQPYDKEKLEQSPFNKVSIIETQTEFEGTTIIRTNGQHGPDAMVKALGDVSGFVFKAKNYPTIYIIGDCIMDDKIKGNIKKYNPDVIVVNSGGAEYGGQRILMNEKEAVEVAKLAPKAKIIAVHMESLDHCKTTRQMVRDEAKKENVNILVPNDGETIKL